MRIFGHADIFEDVWSELAYLLRDLCADGKALFGAFLFFQKSFSLSCIFVRDRASRYREGLQFLFDFLEVVFQVGGRVAYHFFVFLEHFGGDGGRAAIPYIVSLVWRKSDH